jgi:glutathione S-transferase
MALDPKDSAMSSSKTEALKVMNQFLQDRTTLSGTRQTGSDILMFDLLHNTMAVMTFADKEKYLNVSRWFDYLQTLDKVRQDKCPVIFSHNQLY